MLANNENDSRKMKNHHPKKKQCVSREEREVKIPEVTQAIEMEINAVNHDKNKHFHYHFVRFNGFSAFSRSSLSPVTPVMHHRMRRTTEPYHELM